MEHDRAYREEGLSIGGLAGKLGIPEHGLRRLINRRLGYRNFNAFLNRYRLDDVMAALADPAQEAVPILTVAMDAGFQSLGPFNRAFKAQDRHDSQRVPAFATQPDRPGRRRIAIAVKKIG